MISHSAQLSHPPTHWQLFFSPALPSDCFAIDFPGCAISPSELLLRPRVAGAQDQRGCAPIPSSCAFCEQEGHPDAFSTLPSLLVISHRDGG
jgi:hypothetical protein